MAGTIYTVATAAELLGAKPPRRVEADEMFLNRVKKATDKVQRSKANEARTVRFPTTHAAGASDPDGASQDAGTSGELTATISRDRDTSCNGRKGGQKPGIEDGGVAEVNKRLGELRAEKTLPLQHQDKIVASTSTTTTTFDPPTGANGRTSGSLKRNDSTSSRRTRRDSQATEIFFAPLDLHTQRSKVELSEPIDSPDEAEVLTTPTQESYDASLASAGSVKLHHAVMSRSSPRRTLQLVPDQLDRLTKALSDSPLLQMHVRKQWWDEIRDEMSNRGSFSSVDSAPSLSSGSGSASGSSTLYSQPNQPFMAEQRSPSITQAILEEEFALNFPNHPNAKKPAAPRTAKFGGIALTDPRVHGSPIRFISKDYRLGANVVNVGSCSFLNVGYGASVESTLRIEPPSGASVICRVMLQVLNHVLERKTGRKSYVLVAEIDVTECFVKAALAELAVHSRTLLDNIKLVVRPARSEYMEEQVDWCALADELNDQWTVSDTVEAAALSFASLTAETCTMQTLTLMSELERLKTRHQDFMILRPDGKYHANGLPSGVHVPWISQHLDRQLYDSHRDADAARELRYQVVSACVNHLRHGDDFETKIVWHGRLRSVRCVPLLEGGEGRPPAAWVCFLNGESEYLPF